MEIKKAKSTPMLSAFCTPEGVLSEVKFIAELHNFMFHDIIVDADSAPGKETIPESNYA